MSTKRRAFGAGTPVAVHPRMPIAFENEVAGLGDSAGAATERRVAPGKQMLTDRLQRKASGAAPAPSTSASTSPVQLAEDNGLSCDQSFVDSILHGPVQRRADGEAAGADVHALASHGTSGSGGSLPFLDRIQASFGAHDVSHVQAHTDGAAADAARGMGATAFATGDHVAFGAAPDLHTAAHEAAHVVQQRAGVHLKGGVGEVGDAYEQHADAVADRVVRGESAEDLLSAYCAPGAGGASGAVQRAPGKDGEGGGAMATNFQTRIIALSVDGEGTKLTIAAGARHGVTAPMQCRLVSKSGVTLANVTILDVDEKVSYAHTHKTPDLVQEVDHVIVNPGYAKPVHDMNTRIIGTSVEDDKVRVAIGGGSAHGIYPGMEVAFVSESGRTIQRDKIRELRERTSFARWAGTLDSVREVARVVVNPSGE
jgi:hypothetical protein